MICFETKSNSFTTFYKSDFKQIHFMLYKDRLKIYSSPAPKTMYKLASV